ncbi:PPE domain-containing protein [Gordonia malaquae]|uniref:PPE domain-containing protein n=1 Tax=Gordonia malaquae TaxID=410332 RepID=UPI00301B1AA5
MGVEPWGLYPPEINAGRYGSGVGVPTWFAAALEWTAQVGIVAETTATFAAQTGLITGNWAGLGSGKFAGAAAPFAAWLAKMQTMSMVNATASWQVVQTYFTGLMTMVPLPIIIANRVAARTAQIACFLGAPNTEAVRLELEYAAYWAHNGSVMTAYDIGVNSATAFKPVPLPPPLTTGGAGDLASAAKTVADAHGKSVTSQAGQPHAANTAAQQLPQQAMSQSMGMGQQMMNPMMYPPSSGDTTNWGNMLGGGAPLGAFTGGSSSGSGSSSGGGLGGGVGGGLMPTAMPLGEMTRTATPVAAAPAGFSGVPNAPTATRPAAPMMPPMHPHGARKAAASAASPGQVIQAAEQEFPLTIIPTSKSDESGTAQQRAVAV